MTQSTKGKREQKKRALWAGIVARLVLRKCETLSSNLSTAKKEKKKRALEEETL
jgi:hypothetical protein